MNIFGIEQALSVPMPCSPDSEPPNSTQSSAIFPVSFSARSVSPAAAL